MRWGLRGKSLAILAAASLLAILAMTLIGWRLHQVGKNYSAQIYTQNYTELSLQKIYAPISREIAVAQIFADSAILKSWIKAPDNHDIKALFFDELEHYRHAFKDKAVFLAVDNSKAYYFYDDKAASNENDFFTPKYYLSAQNENDSWYFATIAGEKITNINVDIFGRLNLAKIWLNVQIKDGNKVIGLAGTGFDIGAFLERHILTKELGVSAFIFNQRGAIQAHPNKALIAFNSVGIDSDLSHNILGLVANQAEREQLKTLMKAKDPIAVTTLNLHLEGVDQIVSIVYLSELEWFIATAADVNKMQVLSWN